MSRNIEGMHQVASLDWDKCLADAAEVLLQDLEDKGVERVYPGTVRQDEATEVWCTHMGFGASYPGYAEHFNKDGYVFDPTLMQDIYLGYAPGATFNKRKNWAAKFADKNALKSAAISEFKSSRYTQVPGFRSKVDIVFYQMHAAAITLRGEPTAFNFYDDKGDIVGKKGAGVLGPMHDFYAKHSHLIPANVTLVLHQVTENEVTSSHTITQFRSPVASTRLAVVTKTTLPDVRRLLRCALRQTRNTLHPEWGIVGRIGRYMDDGRYAFPKTTPDTFAVLLTALPSFQQELKGSWYHFSKYAGQLLAASSAVCTVLASQSTDWSAGVGKYKSHLLFSALVCMASASGMRNQVMRRSIDGVLKNHYQGKHLRAPALLAR